MKPNGKEADPMSATVIEISSHPRFKPVEFTFNTGRTVYTETIAPVPTGPDPVSILRGGHFDRKAEPAPAPRPPEPKRPEARYLRVAETAKLVRVALKKAFPGVKFSRTPPRISRPGTPSRRRSRA